MSIHRRTLIATIGAGAVGSVAGCSQFGSGSNQADGDGSDGSDGGNGGQSDNEDAQQPWVAG